MNRRQASSLLALLVLAGCGGGGSGAGGVGQASGGGSSQAPAASGFGGTGSIALWGDSHTAGWSANPAVLGYAALVQTLAPSRPVYVGGNAGLTSTELADLHSQDEANDASVSVFWYGGNNPWEPDAIKADLARSIDSLAPGNRRFLVLSVLNQASPWERRGSEGYDTIVQLNADLAALYPDNFLDVRRLLVDRYDPADPQDLADFADDVPPTSLRADGVHLNEAGYALVAEQVLQFIASRGW